jgi:predicted homoserine dehydrogenase-like protein
MFKQPDLVPLDHPVAEAVAVAKRDLGVGDTMGMIGERDYRGFATSWQDARNRRLIPLGLAEKAKVVKPLKAGEMLTYDNCVPDDSLVVTQIRKRLDQSDARFVRA